MKQHTFAKATLFIAIGHLAVGTAMLGNNWLIIAQQGWVNVAGPNNLLASVTVWFFLFSFPLIMLAASHWRNQSIMPRSTMFIGLVGSSIGASLMPASGFWLMVVLCIVGLIGYQKANATSAIS